jgi:hypothetical protein
MAPEPTHAIVKTTDEARQGVTGHNVRYVLATSIIAVIVAFGIAWLWVF